MQNQLEKQLEERIYELECRLAFYEDLSESLNQEIAELNKKSSEQEKIIIEICKELRAIKKSASAVGNYTLAEEIPPHY
ncbi:MAG: SlyX family protein [Cardiobacteriaceae bacterium]|nr:SlyX family protein [Cardiobacteriaceae bacterium]